MKLFYNGLDLATLGELRVIGYQSRREPADAPTGERVDIRVRLDFFEQTFAENWALVEQLREAIGTQHAVLLWQDEDSSNYVERTVVADSEELLDASLERGGTRWLAMVIHFHFYNYDIATNALAATYQRNASGAPELSLDAVDAWTEEAQVSRWDELRSDRKRVEVTIAAAGKFRGDTSQPLITRRAALLAHKDQFLSEIAEGKEGRLKFGTLNRIVRVTRFRVEVDQATHCLRWSLQATYTAWPNELDYSLIEVRIVQRENLADGIRMVTLSGRIGAPDAAKATARLSLLRAALVPSGYRLQQEEITEPRVITESDTSTTQRGDGTMVTELSFNLEYRDVAGIQCTYAPNDVTEQAVDLGTVDRFREGYTGSYFNDMRSVRQRAGGTVTLSGKWFVAESSSELDRQTQLLAKKAALDAAIESHGHGRLKYVNTSVAPNPKAFDRLVRVQDFSAEVNRLRNCVEWTLTATYTRFPDEADYTVCEVQMGTRQDRDEGTVFFTLRGRIGAHTPEVARAKLAQLRATLVPAGYQLRSDDTQEQRVESASGGELSKDGAAFIELTFGDEYQKVSGDLLQWNLRVTDDDDVRSGFIRTTYSGTVKARGASSAAALATARAQADALGANKFTMFIRSSITELSHLVLTDGQVLVMVEFAYEYLRKGTRTWTEVVSELVDDAFGNTTETVSGFIAAPSLALAQAAYEANVRNVANFNGALLLGERRPTLAQVRVGSTGLDERYAFSMTVLRPKNAGQTAVTWEQAAMDDLQRNERRTRVSGTIVAADESTADAFLTAMLQGLDLGRRVSYERRARKQRGPKVTGSGNAEVLVGWDFSADYVKALTGGVNGILESEISMDVTHSSARLVEKPIPTGVSIIQKPGITPGRRTVTARAVGTTESACLAWISKVRANLLSEDPPPYEIAPQVVTRYHFLPQTEGQVWGDAEDQNAHLFEVQAVFGELLPEHPFEPVVEGD